MWLLRYLSGDIADESEGNLVGPGKREELAPPSGDHLCHVEPGEEGDGDEAAEPPGVDAQQLKVLAVGFVSKQDRPGMTFDTLHVHLTSKIEIWYSD